MQLSSQSCDINATDKTESATLNNLTLHLQNTLATFYSSNSPIMKAAREVAEKPSRSATLGLQAKPRTPERGSSVAQAKSINTAIPLHSEEVPDLADSRPLQDPAEAFLPQDKSEGDDIVEGAISIVKVPPPN